MTELTDRSKEARKRAGGGAGERQHALPRGVWGGSGERRRTGEPQQGAFGAGAWSARGTRSPNKGRLGRERGAHAERGAPTRGVWGGSVERTRNAEPQRKEQLAASE